MRLMHQLTLFPAFPQDSIFAKSRMPWERHNTENCETNIPRKGIARPPSQFPHSYVCERFIYIPMISGLPVLLQENMWTDPWEYINRSQTHEC
jgi:hypothetical protein